MPDSPLFHPRVLKKALQQASCKILKNGVIPAKHLTILQNWQGMIDDGSIQQQSEGNLQPLFFSQLCETILGYHSMSRRHKTTGVWTLANEAKVKRTGRVDIGFGQFSAKHKQLLAPLELKSPKTHQLDVPMLGRRESAVEQAARYARNSEGQAQWFVVSNCVEIRLYKYPYSDAIYQSWQIAELTQAEKYAEFVLLLGEKSLLTGKTTKLFNDSLQVEKDITNALYADYREIRVKLINGMKRDNNRIRRATMVNRAQTLLDRVLFIAYAEDKDLLPDRTLHTYISQANPVMSRWDMLKKLFSDINLGNPQQGIPKYNGDLFKPHSDLEDLQISDDLLGELQRLWEYDFDTDVSVTILGHIFEQSIADLDQIYEAVVEDDELQLSQQQHGTSGKRKQDGVVYTPDFITEWIVAETLGAHLNQQKKRIPHEVDSLAWWQTYREYLAKTRILDPACGSGAFLVAAFQYLKKEYAQLNQRLKQLGDKGDLFTTDLNHDILNNNLFGVDINAESVEIARLSLWLVTAEKGKPLTSLKDNIRQGNSLIQDKSVDKLAFKWFGQFREFDVILGNPPYVRQERLSTIKPYLAENYQTYHGVADLYSYFFERGLSVLKKGGTMGFISSSTFFKTGSGENLREFLKVHSNLRSIVDFGDLQIFAGVTTYPAILIMSKPARSRKQAPKDHSFRFLTLATNKVSDVSRELEHATFSEMKQAKLAREGWRLEDEHLQALRGKIINGKPNLKAVYGQPLYGLKTGLNAAFVINKATYQQIIQQNPQSKTYLKPFLEGKDLKKWRAESRQLYLILFPKGWTRQQMQKTADETISESVAWQWLQQQHPIICDWLAPFAEKARKRSDKGEFWWELRNCAYYRMFEKLKIVYVDIGKQPTFVFDESCYYCANTIYFIPNSERFLIGLLNSNVFWFLITGKTNAIRGGFHRLFTKHMETVPIPKASDDEKSKIAQLAKECQQLAEQRYQQQHTLRRRIPDLRPADCEAKLSKKLIAWWELDFSAFQQAIKQRFKYDMTLQERIEWQSLFDDYQAKIQDQSQQLHAKETELNQAVYCLFQLTPNEIELLESHLR
jgi:type I restriction-modification system DNA methylase subunit